MRTEIKANGQWVENRPYSKDGHWNINYSDILTRLIQSAGRFCKSYASDLFITWSEIDDDLKNGNLINDTYIFAVRSGGVDHKAFYEIRKKEPRWYHEVWELTIETEDDGKWMTMTLKEIA